MSFLRTFIGYCLLNQMDYVHNGIPCVYSSSTDIEDLLAPIKVPRKDIKMTNKSPRKYEDVVSSFATYELQKNNLDPRIWDTFGYAI